MLRANAGKKFRVQLFAVCHFIFLFEVFFFAGVPYFILSLKFSPIPFYVCVFWGSTPFFYLIDTPIERFSIVFQYFFLSSSHQYKL